MTSAVETGVVTPAELNVQPLAGRIGAEIRDIDISEPLSPEVVEGIRQTLDTWRVVFFRDQHLDHASQVAFGRQFGELTYAHPHDDLPPDGHPEIYTVDRTKPRHAGQARRDPASTFAREYRRSSRFAGWHTDVTPAINPPAGSILRADILPPYGGDTTFTNLVAAYEGLSEPVQAFVDTLRAEHRYGANRSGRPRRPDAEERFQQNALVSNHPSCGYIPAPARRHCSSTPVSSTTSSTSARSRATGSSTSSSPS